MGKRIKGRDIGVQDVARFLQMPRERQEQSGSGSNIAITNKHTKN
jgi:hypothetical protein